MKMVMMVTLQWGLQRESSFVTEVPVNLRIFASTCSMSPWSSHCRPAPPSPGPQVCQGSQDLVVDGHQAGESSAGAACQGNPSAFSCPLSAPDQMSESSFRFQVLMYLVSGTVVDISYRLSNTWSGIGGSLLAAWQGHITGREKAAISGSCIPDPAFSPAPPPESKVTVYSVKQRPLIKSEKLRYLYLPRRLLKASAGSH